MFFNLTFSSGWNCLFLVTAMLFNKEIGCITFYNSILFVVVFIEKKSIDEYLYLYTLQHMDIYIVHMLTYTRKHIQSPLYGNKVRETPRRYISTASLRSIKSGPYDFEVPTINGTWHRALALRQILKYFYIQNTKALIPKVSWDFVRIQWSIWMTSCGSK